MVLDWYTTGMRGDKPDMPAKGYTLITTSDLSKEIQALIEKHGDEELFDKRIGNNATVLTSFQRPPAITTRLLG